MKRIGVLLAVAFSLVVCGAVGAAVVVPHVLQAKTFPVLSETNQGGYDYSVDVVNIPGFGRCVVARSAGVWCKP